MSDPKTIQIELDELKQELEALKAGIIDGLALVRHQTILARLCSLRDEAEALGV